MKLVPRSASITRAELAASEVLTDYGSRFWAPRLPNKESHVSMDATALEHGPANNGAGKQEPFSHPSPEPFGFFLHDHGLPTVDLADLEGLASLTYHQIVSVHVR